VNRLSIGAGALVLGAALFAGASLAPLSASREEPEAATKIATSDVVSPVGSSDAIPGLIARIDRNGDDPSLHAQLGLAYLQKFRDEADPGQLPPAEEALRASLELDAKDNLEAFVGMASLSNARHDFSTSVKWSRKAIAGNRFDPAAYGLLGDALFELGRVEVADAAYQKMIDLRPDVASYVRASYALGYQGRTRAALHAMRLALQAAGPSGETSAWVRHQMGDIYAGLGNNREAARQNRIGIAVAPGYVPPTVGLAESFIARGRLEEALSVMEEAAADLPALEYMITLGELLQATDRHAEAAAQYEAVARKLGDYRAAGVLTDADFIVFYADHGLRLPAALVEAREAYLERPTPKMADALAWVLKATGRHREAWTFATEALRGPDDAMVRFHAATIASSLRMRDRASALAKSALELDPGFSLIYADEARALASL
jgi:tetratricopeptide (TPR) repeat protein